MAFSLALERAYLSKEYSRPQPSAMRVVGTLLDSAFSQPGKDGRFDDLLRQLPGAAH